MEDPANFVTLNSITNNEEMPGRDERFFIYATEAGTNNYRQELTLQRGKAYYIYVYFDNDIAPNLHYLANDVILNLAVPHEVKDSAIALATITSNSALPSLVQSSIAFGTYDPVTLDLVPNSALIHVGDVEQHLQLTDITNENITLGCGNLDGQLTGETRCRGYVGFTIFTNYSKFDHSMFARHNANDHWSESITVRRGDDFELESRFWNSGTVGLDNVTFSVKPPSGITRSGVVTVDDWTTPKGRESKNPEDLTGGGLSVGHSNRGTSAYVHSNWHVGDIACGSYQLTGKLLPDGPDSDAALNVMVVGC